MGSKKLRYTQNKGQVTSKLTRLSIAIMPMILMILLNSCTTGKIHFRPEFVIWEIENEQRGCMTKEKVKELRRLLIEQEFK